MKNRSIARWAPRLGALAAVALMGCASIETRTDYDTAYDFSGLQTWSWASPEYGVAMDENGRRNDLAERRIREALVSQLEAHGYRRVEQGGDFRVIFVASAQEEVDVSTMYTSVGVGWRYPVAETTVREYTEGSLVVEALHGTEDRMIWQGTASGTIRPGEDPEDSAARVNEAVARLLDDFPPQR